ncbi:MAG: hypothetical protein COT34_02230 [Candidatus Nealsonbacteria bacterium CG08_land_8_20_14_0_20_43_11]|uniref:Baseplate protein J-like domain-containing protein n=1 Tax=Candidatus Nealsonbacteria bacterium CG08_land_8_20_14_0_20_43_11 TaxID=1974706 RepID=A0A2M6T072_9BACT|nr:MAG: hypothetical protein COT34_02230 [Candidatus Nealsonbacteria bacterium CG08_land_8_20_14_0_20_43_11]
MDDENKKIFDIVPPQKKIAKKELNLRQAPKKEKPKRGRRLFLFLILLLVAATGAYFFFSRIEILVWPETQAIEFIEKAELDTKLSELNLEKKRLPATILEVSQDLAKDFTPTGRIPKEEKAQGKIRVYNAYSEEDQVLVANTRFLSAEGKLFRSTERVTIPGGTEEKGKLVPGFLDIIVVAAEPGEGYNIGPATFSLPGLAGTRKYTAFYAKSFAPMAGGFRGEILQVTKEDLEKAKNSLIAELFEKENRALQEKASQDLVLLGGAVKQEIREDSCSAKEGMQVSSFTMRARMVLKAILFKKSDLESFAKELALARMLENEPGRESFFSGREIQPQSLRIDSQLEAVDFDSGRATIRLAISARAFYNLNEPRLKKAIVGRSLEETKVFLENQPQIKKAELRAWPFWIGAMPSQERRLKIKMKLAP